MDLHNHAIFPACLEIIQIFSNLSLWCTARDRHPNRQTENERLGILQEAAYPSGIQGPWNVKKAMTHFNLSRCKYFLNVKVCIMSVLLICVKKLTQVYTRVVFYRIGNS